MLVPLIDPATLMLFLHARGAGLESRQVDGIRLHQLFGHGDDVGDEVVEEVEGHAFADDNAEDFGGLTGWGEGVVLFGLVGK
ncbi:MAG: hypothetical protein Q9223_007361 [Gallowayella weberi]